MSNGINNKKQNVIYEFSPVTVYGDEKETNILSKLSKKMLNLVNEPEDPYEIRQYFPWGEKEASRSSEATPKDLFNAIIGLRKVPGEILDLITHAAAPDIAKLSLEEDYVKNIKSRELEESADWMKYWFNSPYTKERLEKMGHTDEEIEEIVSQASNIKGMSFDEISKRKRGDDRDLVWSTDRPPIEEKPDDATAWYNISEHYVFSDPYPQSQLGYLLPKDPYMSRNIHEFAHGIMRDDKLTDKELKLFDEADKVVDMPDDELIKYVTDPEGPYRPYQFKNIPYMYGGAWKETPPGKGWGMQPKYYNDPSEIYSRIFELRKHLDAKPGEVIDMDDIEEIKHYPAVNDLLRYIPIKEVWKLVNTLALDSKIEDKLINSFASEEDVFKEPKLT